MREMEGNEHHVLLHYFLLTFARTQVQRVMKAIESREEAQLAKWEGIYTSNEIWRGFLFTLFCSSSLFSMVGRPVEACSLKAVSCKDVLFAWSFAQCQDWLLFLNGESILTCWLKVWVNRVSHFDKPMFNHRSKHRIAWESLQLTEQLRCFKAPGVATIERFKKCLQRYWAKRAWIVRKAGSFTVASTITTSWKFTLCPFVETSSKQNMEKMENVDDFQIFIWWKMAGNFIQKWPCWQVPTLRAALLFADDHRGGSSRFVAGFCSKRCQDFPITKWLKDAVGIFHFSVPRGHHGITFSFTYYSY